MKNKETIQARQDARNLRSVTRLAIRALRKACRSLRRRSRAYQGWDGPDAEVNEKLQEKIASAIEPLDECLEAVASRRALGHERDPSSESRAERKARRCERLAGRALTTLLSLQDELDEGEWSSAFTIAHDGVKDLEHRLEAVTPGPARKRTPIEDVPPIADLPEPPVAEEDTEAA